MKKRKIFSAALAAVLAAAAPLAGAVNNALSVTASAMIVETKTDGDWEYCVNEDGETVWVIKYNGSDTEIEFPAVLDGKTVTLIGNNDYPFADTVTSVKIPDGVTAVGGFRDCTSLTSVTIPNSVTTIGNMAFRGCTSLKSITIPANTRIGMWAFGSCTMLKDLTLPNGVTVGFGAFQWCKSLESVTLSDGVELSDDQIFKGCSSLKNVTLPGTLTSIGANTFDDCIALESITIPKSVTNLHGQAFSGCTSLKTVIYGGTKDEWDAIEILGVLDESLKNAEIIFNAFANDDTSNPTDSTVTPGDTDKPAEQEVLEATLKNVDSENGIEGAALDKLLFGETGWTWNEVEKVVFTSEKPFSVQFAVDNDGWKTLGEEAARAETDGRWSTEWTLNASEMAKDKKYAKVIAKEGTTDVKATIYLKKGAAKPSGEDQQPTGITLALAPAVLAAGAAIVLLKKRK